jgi:hypothetical protein
MIPTHLTKYDAALPENLLLIVIIDAIPGPENFILITGQCALELFLYLSRPHATPQPHGPEGSVVEIVDVTVYLAPGEVVAEVTERGVTDRAGIEGGEVWWLERGQVVGRPQVHIEGGECGEDSGEQFGGTALEERAAFVEDETAFIHFKVPDMRIWEGCAMEN